MAKNLVLLKKVLFIKVKMLEPIYPDKYTSQSDMLKSTYQIMQEENGKLNEKKSND